MLAFKTNQFMYSEEMKQELTYATPMTNKEMIALYKAFSGLLSEDEAYTLSKELVEIRKVDSAKKIENFKITPQKKE